MCVKFLQSVIFKVWVIFFFSSIFLEERSVGMPGKMMAVQNMRRRFPKMVLKCQEGWYHRHFIITGKFYHRCYGITQHSPSYAFGFIITKLLFIVRVNVSYFDVICFFDYGINRATSVRSELSLYIKGSWWQLI